MGRIVVGVDGSPASKRALSWAADQARATGDELEIVTSWEIPTWLVSGSAAASAEPVLDYDFAGEAARSLKEAVAEVLGEPGELHYREIVAEGHPAVSLVRHSEGAELLVVGSRGHGEFAGMLLGSVSMYVAAHAHCPVLIIR
jgi:nucleotide-binding universal stress UspA family protein